MSEKKSPPHKDKSSASKLLQSDGKLNKRKLMAPTSPTEDDDKKAQQQQQVKRKRPNMPEGSPEHVGIGSPRGAGTVSRLNVPLSERQQMALLMRMQDESTVGDSSPKSPSSGSQVSSTKRTPADKKVNKRNERGEAPLHMAAKKGDYKQTKRLIKAGASVNMKDYAGWTALHEACNSGNLRVARCLLKAGADVNVQGFDDDTPLHDASSYGHKKLVQLLLRHGANPLQPNQKGKTAISMASSSEIEALLKGTGNYSSDIDSHSDGSSSDSNSSSKDDDRSNLDDEFKPHGTPVKQDPTGPSPSISSTVGSSVASLGNSFIRRQNVPPSPDKLAANTRLLMKIQSKKSSSNIDEQPKTEWDVLTVNAGCEVTSESESNSSRLLFDRQKPPKLDEPRLVQSSLRINRPHITDNDGCPDSTVAPPGSSLSTLIPLERTATEPFTPRGIDNVTNSDSEEQCDVFSSAPSSNVKSSNMFANTALCSNLSHANEASKQPAIQTSHQPRPQQHLSLSLQQQHSQQHIPGQTISTYQGIRHSSKLQNTHPTLPSSSIGLEQSGLSSSFQPSSMSSHSRVGTSCQFSLVSSSSSLPSSSSSAVLGTGLTHNSQHTSQYQVGHNTQTAPSSTSHLLSDSRSGSIPTSLTFQSFSARGNKGGGSIVTGLSDRAVAASGSAALSSLTTAPTQNTSIDLNRASLPRLDEKSDTSSCDSPLRVDQDDSNPISSEQGSRPSTPKVPPLKIIMPPKVGGPSANISKPLTKPALPYVVNPITESESWDVLEEGGQRTLQNCSLSSIQDAGDFPSSRPSSRSGAGVPSSDSALKTDQNRNLDNDETGSRESDLRAEQTDGSGGKSDEGKEKRPTRTLRSHTAMMQQQQQKERPTEKERNGGTDVKEEVDNCSTTKSQKGDETSADDSSFPPRKRKLRNKTEQQTLLVSAGNTATAKISQPLEKPPNPYETYLNLRRRIASRHRTLCNVTPKPPNGFKDFLMVNCTYILQGNATSTLSIPMLPPPNLVTEPMREFFIQQEKERYRLRLQHVIEREKLMLSIEQEILREHGRAARAMANQTLPFSVCTILREEEIYNQQELEQVEDRDKNTRSRYNGRQFLSWLQDVDDKYEKIKQLLLLRHHHEAESLYAVQKLDWEWKLKECGLCDHKNTPVIDDLHVPMVTVSDEFELLPNS